MNVRCNTDVHSKRTTRSPFPQVTFLKGKTRQAEKAKKQRTRTSKVLLERVGEKKKKISRTTFEYLKSQLDMYCTQFCVVETTFLSFKHSAYLITQTRVLKLFLIQKSCFDTFADLSFGQLSGKSKLAREGHRGEINEPPPPPL